MRTTGITRVRAFARAISIITVASLVLLGLTPPSAVAAQFTVCDTGCDYTAIQPAIDAATSGDTITVGAGTYAGFTVGKPLTIRGIEAGLPATDVARTGGETTISGSYPISIESGSVTLDGLEVTGFRHGIFMPAAAFAAAPSKTLSGITLTNLWVHSDNAATEGTGFTAEPGILDGLTITDSVFDVTVADLVNDYALAAIGFSSGDATPTYQHITIARNTIVNRSEGYGLFAGADPAAYVIDGMVIDDNVFDANVNGSNFNIGNIAPEGAFPARFAGNIVRNTGGTIGLVDGTIEGNTFEDGGRLGLWGTVFGFTRPTDNVTIAHNDFTLEGPGRGITIDPYADPTYVQDLGPGYGLPAIDAASLSVRENAFRDNGVAGAPIRNYGTGTLDASVNWWGDAAGASANAGTNVGSVTTSPWVHEYTDDPAKAGEPGFWPTDITYASAPVTLEGGTDPAPASFADPSTGASISIDLPTLDTGGTLAVESLTKPGASEAGATFSEGSVFFDIAFDGTLTDPATICLTYPGGGNWPVGTRLYHYVGGAWTDVTTSLVGGVLCGEVTSFSPFAAGIITLSSPPEVTNVAVDPLEQPYGGDVTITADVTDSDGTIASVEYTIDGGTSWHPMTFTSGTEYSATIVKPDAGTYTASVKATDSDGDFTTVAADDDFVILPAETFIAFTGNAYNTSTTVRLEATVSGQCKVGREVTFAIDLNEDGDFVDIVDTKNEVVGTAMTNSAGVTTLSYTGLTSGSIKDVLVSVQATSNCTEAVGTAVIIVAGTGDASNGGGSYTSTGRMNFGYSLQVKTDRKTSVKTVSGQVLWQKQGSVRIKGIITGYTTGGAYCPPLATGTCGLITGSASIYHWDGTAWIRDAANVAFRIQVADGGTSVTCLKKNGSCTTNLKPDWFQIWVPGLPSLDGTSSTTGYQIRGGNIVVK